MCVVVDGPGTPTSAAPALVASTGFVAPVPRPLRISSTFGPRWKTSAGRTDFHPGIDYFDDLGTEVYAIGAGTVRGVHPEGSTTFPNGGNVLVVEHALPPGVRFHGVDVSRFFAVYLHLDTFAVALDQAVAAGEVVGTMGMTGDTEFVHLHFETRVQSSCSLPYQVAHQDASCVTGFDPHVHPYLFVGGENDDAIGVTEIPTDAAYAVRYEATRGDLDLDVVATDLGTLGFGERLGLDATSLATLDDFDLGWVRLVPLPFGSSSDVLAIELHFASRPSTLEFRDVHGVGIRY